MGLDEGLLRLEAIEPQFGFINGLNKGYASDLALVESYNRRTKTPLKPLISPRRYFIITSLEADSRRDWHDQA
jgi:hypothetical protein